MFFFYSTLVVFSLSWLPSALGHMPNCRDASVPSKEMMDVILDANNAYRAKNYPWAKLLTEDYLDKHPNSSYGILLLAKISMATPQWKEATLALEQYLAKEPEDKEALLMMAKVRYHLRDFEGAGAAIDIYIGEDEDASKNILALEDAVFRYMINKDYKQAALLRSKIFEAQPENLDNVYALVELLSEYLGREDEALQVLMNVPTFGDPDFEVARIRMKAQPDLNRAYNVFLMGRAKDQVSSRDLRGEAAFLRNRGDYEGRRVLLQKITEIAPEKIFDLINIAYAHQNLGQFSEALRYNKLYLNINPANLEVITALILLHIQMNNYPVALDEIDARISQYPFWALNFLLLKAEVLARTDRRMDAYKVLDQIGNLVDLDVKEVGNLLLEIKDDIGNGDQERAIRELIGNKPLFLKNQVVDQRYKFSLRKRLSKPVSHLNNIYGASKDLLSGKITNN